MLQVWHWRSFQSSGLFAARIDIQGSSEVFCTLIFVHEISCFCPYLMVEAKSLIGVACTFHW